MNLYLWIKLLHIVGATVLFGTGLGTAFFMLKAYVIVQLMTGLWLTHKVGIPFSSAWFVAVISLFAFVGACWIPVV